MVHPPHALRLSVVLPVYNDPDNLTDALVRLSAQTLPPHAYEIVVIDDGSTDHTPEVIAQAGRGAAQVRPIRLERNRGRAAARNAGIRAARAPLIVFVDSDVLVVPGFLAAHLTVHDGAARPVLGRGPVAAISTRAIPSRPPFTRISSGYLDTANASIPRSALIDVGLFDEQFRAYGWEDFDLGLRLQARGIRRVFSGAALAYHVVPPPSAETLDRYLRKEEERAQTALYLLRKYPGLATRMLIQDTLPQRFVHFLLGGAGIVTMANAPAIARWLEARGLQTLAFLAIRGVLTRHYLRALDRYRAAPAAS